MEIAPLHLAMPWASQLEKVFYYYFFTFFELKGHSISNTLYTNTPYQHACIT